MLFVTLLPILGACNAKSSKNQYDLAERLFEEKKYGASVHEFRKVVKKDPKSELGIDSLYRVGVIQRLYLHKPNLAIQSFQSLLSRTEDPDLERKIREMIGEMYFSDFNDFQQAAKLYAILVKDKSPKNKKRAFYLYRYGRALFLMGNFKQALDAFGEIEEKYSDGRFYEKARLALGDTLNSSGQCHKAIKAYEELSKSSDKKIRSMSIFGMANCYEEIDNLDKAYDLLTSIKDSYSTPYVVDLKMKKIKRRKILRRR